MDDMAATRRRYGTFFHDIVQMRVYTSPFGSILVRMYRWLMGGISLEQAEGETGRLCQAKVHSDYVERIFGTYRNDTTRTCHLAVWMGRSPSPQDILAVALFQTIPGGHRIDLLCASKGSGTRALKDMEAHLGKGEVVLDATWTSWTFYWQRGYRLDHRLIAKSMKSYFRNDMEHVRKYLAMREDTIMDIPMMKRLS